MHFEVLVEDASGKIALESILGKILGPNGQDHTWKIISYKGVGRIPKNLRGTIDHIDHQSSKLPLILSQYSAIHGHVNK